MSLIVANNLGKVYRKYSSEWKRVAGWYGWPVEPATETWVLRHINFAIERGESVGVVGQNGAGKSTLLKILSKALLPTEGRLHVGGRVGSILELGTGFNHELSGRENVRHIARLMGHDAETIRRAEPEIEAFADIGKYYDVPVRTYSSGMQMRVAFAVAVGFDPDILIVDEAMAVGDAYFQQKCFARIDNFKSAGGTLLFVSHDARLVKSLCSRAILLDEGRLIKDGSPREVVDLYQGIMSKLSDLGEKPLSIRQEPPSPLPSQQEIRATTVTTNGDATLESFELLDGRARPVAYVESENLLVVSYRVRLHKDFERPAFGLIIRDRVGQSVFETSTYAMKMEIAPIEKGKLVSVTFRFCFNLRAGQYSFSVGVSNKGYLRSEFEEISLLMHDVEQIQVIEAPQAIFYGGVYNMNPEVSVVH